MYPFVVVCFFLVSGPCFFYGLTVGRKSWDVKSMSDEKVIPLGLTVTPELLRACSIAAPRKGRGRPKRVEPWPWEVLGLTRTTYYRLKKLGKLPSGGTEA